LAFSLSYTTPPRGPTTPRRVSVRRQTAALREKRSRALQARLGMSKVQSPSAAHAKVVGVCGGAGEQQRGSSDSAGVQRCKSCESYVRTDFGWEIAHEAVSRRPPISLYTMVPRTGGYTYTVGVWDPSFKDPFSVAPCQTLAFRFATLGPSWARARVGPREFDYPPTEEGG
jgi:hypothetical protein